MFATFSSLPIPPHNCILLCALPTQRRHPYKTWKKSSLPHSARICDTNPTMPRQRGGGGHRPQYQLMLLAFASWSANVLAMPTATRLDQKVLRPIESKSDALPLQAQRKLSGRFLHISGASSEIFVCLLLAQHTQPKASFASTGACALSPAICAVCMRRWI